MPAPERPGTSHAPIDVLIVDDSAVVRQRLKSIIETDSRFHVILAADPYEAVALLNVACRTPDSQLVMVVLNDCEETRRFHLRHRGASATLEFHMDRAH